LSGCGIYCNVSVITPSTGLKNSCHRSGLQSNKLNDVLARTDTLQQQYGRPHTGSSAAGIFYKRCNTISAPRFSVFPLFDKYTRNIDIP
jgi:hypothetical protein